MVGGHRVPGTLLGYLQEHLESRVEKEYRCTFVDHANLFLSFLNCFTADPCSSEWCLHGTGWCLLTGTDLEPLGWFVPVWPHCPYVEDVKVFLRTAQRH